LDSIGEVHENGQKIILHRLEAKETYFGLSRQYGTPVKAIIAANNNKPLKIGDTVRVPAVATQAVPGAAGSQTGQQPAPAPTLTQDEYTQYKVGKGETLFTISKRFSISVESIKRANGLTSDQLKEGTILKIPHK